MPTPSTPPTIPSTSTNTSLQFRPTMPPPQPLQQIIYQTIAPHIQPPRKFNGKTSVVHWWTAFMAYVTFVKFNPQEICQILPNFLEGPAETWFYTLTDTVRSSVDIFKEALFKRFRPSQLNVELMDIRQGENETDDDY